MVGREAELGLLMELLVRASEGHGGTVLLAGEAGVGKTALLEALKGSAAARGVRVMSCACTLESLTFLMPFREALFAAGHSWVFVDEAPRIDAAYVATIEGLLLGNVVRKESQLDPDIFIAMLTAVGLFVKDSVGLMEGAKAKGELQRLTYGDHSIIIESRNGISLAVVIVGRETKALLHDIRELLGEVVAKYGEAVKSWGGRTDRVQGIADLLRTLVESDRCDEAYHEMSDPRERRDLVYGRVVEVLTREARRSPVLFCLEDLQWADPSSLWLLQRVARSAMKCPLLIVGTYRPEELSPRHGQVHHLEETLAAMRREGLFATVNLSRLPRSATLEIVRDTLGRIACEDQFVERIYAETEGNPLFIVELIRLLVEDGSLRLLGGQWEVAAEATLAKMPTKVQEVVVGRLSRLDPAIREVLELASVIGEEFPADLLCAAAVESRIVILKALRRLEEVHRLVRARNGTFRFDHAKVKEVLYNTIPNELRLEYHSAVAAALESLRGEGSDATTYDLAFHFSRARNREKGVRYLLKAAAAAASTYANVEAARYYTEALDLETDKAKRAVIYGDLGSVYETLEETERAAECYLNGLKLWTNEVEMAEFAAKLGAVRRKEGKLGQAIQHCHDAIAFARRHRCAGLARALDTIGLIYHDQGRYEAALGYHRRSLEVWKRLGDRTGIAACTANMALLERSRKEYEDDIEVARSARRPMQAIRDAWHYIVPGGTLR